MKRGKEQLIQEKDALYDELNQSIGRQIHSELEVQLCMWCVWDMFATNSFKLNQILEMFSIKDNVLDTIIS